MNIISGKNVTNIYFAHIVRILFLGHGVHISEDPTHQEKERKKRKRKKLDPTHQEKERKKRKREKREREKN